MKGLLRRWLAVGCVGISLKLGASVWANGPVPGVGGLPTGVDPGEILISELNCGACHWSETGAREYFRFRPAPILGRSGMWLSPGYLRSFLTNPEHEKPGMTMPDVLHGMGAEENAATVEALVHYLISEQEPEGQPVSADLLRIQQGRTLYHSVGCVACHDAQESVSAVFPRAGASGEVAPGQSDSAVLSALESSSIALGHLARKTTVPELAKFLADPARIRPGGRMPSFNLTSREAQAVAMYLLREQAPGLSDSSSDLRKIPGLTFEYYERVFREESPDFDQFKPVGSGTVDRFTLEPRQRDSNFGFRFSGLLRISTAGQYRFYSNSDDGSRLYIDGVLVVKNDGFHPMTEGQGSIELAAGDHPIMLAYFNGGGEWGLTVSYEGPGISKREVDGEILFHLGEPMKLVSAESWDLDLVKARQGRELFSKLGCAHCHGGLNQVPPETSKPLRELSSSPTRGCLDEQIKPGLPDYRLNPEQRRAIRVALTRTERWNKPRAPSDEVRRTMAAFNCFACHERDGFGGPDRTRGAYFTTNEEADLGDEGRLPPHLTGVGAKLRPEWIEEVLWKKGAVRPYMAVRMPQFGRTNIEHLAAAFFRADANSSSLEKPADRTDATISHRAAKWGRKLAGRDGLSCIACHNFGRFKSLGIPAMDLTQMARRLNRDWFKRYMVDPAGLRPGTRMPTFWPEGKAVNSEILNGNTEEQIAALWAFLSQGAEAETPSGLVQAKMELVPSVEPIIYRNFIEGAGARGIAVGYPERVHLAFDAAEGRVTMMWQGAFIDASRHRNDRGAGFEPPLGENIIRPPVGVSFAFLEDAAAVWPEFSGRKAGYRNRGYELDQERRPTFLYEFDGLKVTDRFVPVRGELDSGFSRTITLRAERGGLWFRAATGRSIRGENGGFVIDGKWNVRVGGTGVGEPLVRQSGGNFELLVPIQPMNGGAIVLEEFSW